MLALRPLSCLPLALGLTLVAAQEPSDAPLLPLPKSALVIAPRPDVPLTLAKLLEQLTATTGVTFSYESSVAKRLELQRVELSAPVELSPQEAYPWVEGLLVQNGFGLGILHLGDKPLVGVFNSMMVPGAVPIEATPQHVPIERIETCRQHPALKVETVIDMGPNVDVRTLGNSLRGMTGNNQACTIMPIANTSTVVVLGLGLEVANLSATLLDMRATVDESVGRERAAGRNGKR